MNLNFEKTLAWLRGKNVVVYDLEIGVEIGEIVKGHKVGWSDHDRMRIASGVLFDYRSGDTYVYFEQDIPLLVQRLNEADLVVGFNSKGFDNALLRAQGHLLHADSLLPNYDILEETRISLGMQRGTEKWQGIRGCNLDEHCKAMLGPQMGKTGNGALAPVLFKEGKLGELITYNIADVRRTRLCFEHIWLHGTTITARNGTHLVKHPGYFLKENKNGIPEKSKSPSREAEPDLFNQSTEPPDTSCSSEAPPASIPTAG